MDTATLQQVKTLMDMGMSTEQIQMVLGGAVPTAAPIADETFAASVGLDSLASFDIEDEDHSVYVGSTVEVTPCGYVKTSEMINRQLPNSEAERIIVAGGVYVPPVGGAIRLSRVDFTTSSYENGMADEGLNLSVQIVVVPVNNDSGRIVLEDSDGKMFFPDGGPKGAHHIYRGTIRNIDREAAMGLGRFLMEHGYVGPSALVTGSDEAGAMSRRYYESASLQGIPATLVPAGTGQRLGYADQRRAAERGLHVPSFMIGANHRVLEDGSERGAKMPPEALLDLLDLDTRIRLGKSVEPAWVRPGYQRTLAFGCWLNPETVTLTGKNAGEWQNLRTPHTGFIPQFEVFSPESKRSLSYDAYSS